MKKQYKVEVRITIDEVYIVEAHDENEAIENAEDEARMDHSGHVEVSHIESFDVEEME